MTASPHRRRRPRVAEPTAKPVPIVGAGRDLRALLRDRKSLWSDSNGGGHTANARERHKPGGFAARTQAGIWHGG